MTCPDLDRLIDLYHGLRDPELEEHVRTCASCRADLETILWFPVAWGSQVEVPEGLVERVLEALPLEKGRPESQPETVGQRLVTGFLVSVAAAFALLASGSAADGPPALLLVLSLVTGAVGGMVRVPHGIWVEESEA